jgi:hypothetical protein
VAEAEPFVSVIVPVRNGARALPGLVDAVRRQDYPPDRRELIVVDNGSEDGTEAAVRRAGSVRHVIEPTPGAYAARNAGVGAASGELLAFTDVDCRPAPSWLSTAARALADRGLDVLAGRIDQTPEGAANLFETIDHLVYLRQRWYARQGFGATANLVMRRAAYDAVGGFDGRLRSSGDRAFCHAAVRAGFRFGYCDEAGVAHRPAASASELARREVRIGCGFGQLARLRAGERGVGLFAQTYLPVPGIRACLLDAPPDVPLLRRTLCLTVYGLVRVPCRTLGFMKGLLTPDGHRR